jgi:hypothetical protein
MKKVYFILISLVFLAGCGTAVKESGYYDHNTHYRDFDHMKFSILGYKNIEPKDVEVSTKENWWGLKVEEKKCE